MDTRKWTKRLLRLPSCSCALLLRCQSPLLSLPPPLFLPTQASMGLAGILSVRAGRRCLGKGHRHTGPSVERHLAPAPLHMPPCANLAGSCIPLHHKPPLSCCSPQAGIHPHFSQLPQRGYFSPTALTLWILNCDSLNLGFPSPKKTPQGGWGSHLPVPEAPIQQEVHAVPSTNRTLSVALQMRASAFHTISNSKFVMLEGRAYCCNDVI